jgi:hypothetical protein
MALVLADRVKETTTSTGTTAITLAGAVTGYQTFSSAVGNANTTYYTIADQTGANWEVGTGTYTSAGNTLSRDTVLSSSNAGSLVNFTSGTKDVFVTYPAGKSTYQGGTFSLVAGTNVTVTGTWPNQTIAASGGGGSATKTISNKTGAYTIVSGDLGTIINCTSGTFTVSLTAAATLGSGFTCTIWNTGTGAITIDPNAAETIDGKTTLILRAGEGTDIVCDGTNWQTSYKKTMRYYSENTASTSTRPSATGAESVAIHVSATASAAVSLAFGYIANATAFGASAIGERTTAGSLYSTALGTNSSESGSVTATGAGAMALGGSYASGTDSFAAAIASNSAAYGALGANSIAMGKLGRGGSPNSIGIGNGAVANGTYGVAIGYNLIASSTGAVAIGISSSATSSFSAAIGNNAIADKIGKYAYSSGQFAVAGDAQYGLMGLRAATTTTTAVALTSDGAAATTTNQLIVASGKAMALSGTLIAKQTASGNMAGWTITGIVSNNAGTMAVSGLALTPIGVDSIVLGVNLPTIAVDNTNKGVTITSGFKAATNIRWVANVQTSEVTYA